MSGTIPPSLGNLTRVQKLGLQSNPSLSGTIPPSLGNLPHAQVLGLESNPSLSGTIPPSLGNLPHAQVLSLNSNPSLSGTIPPSLGNLTQAQQLYLDTNPSLSGTIPPSLGNLSQAQGLSLNSNPSLSGTIPPSLGKLTQAQQLFLYSNPSLSGTIPPSLGNLPQAQVLHLSSNPSLSGTIPPSLGNLSHVQVLSLYNNPSLSGTIPPSLGNLPQAQWLYLLSNPLLSGTIPSSLGNLMQAQELHLSSNPLLSGTIPPSLGNLSHAQELHLSSNPSLSGTIPPSLGNLPHVQSLYLDTNPSLSGTIPPSLGNLPQVQRMYLFSNPSLSGTIPPMSNCAALRVLNLGNSSLSTLPGALPRNLTHLYLARNPIVAHAADLRTLLNATPTLHSLEVAFTNARIVLDMHGGTDTGSLGGTVVTNPSPCRVGGACAFTLQLVDEFVQPVRQGGLIGNLSLRFSGSHAALMRDNRDGTFTAPIDPSWIAHKGRFEFHFEHAGAEFWPMANTATTYAGASDCNYPPQPSDRCASLRMVKFEPRACPDGSHTVADAATGAVCECKPGFAPDPGRGVSVRSCHRLCETGTKATASNDGCECDGTSYNATATGTLLCVASQVGSPQPLLSHAAARVGRDCRPCPDECATCAHGVATLRAGWRLNAPTFAALRSQLGGAGTVYGGVRVQLAFLCPYAGSHAMGPGDTGPDCPSLELRAPTTTNSSDGNSILACRDNHTGVLCALCRPGFSRKGSSDNRCVACVDGELLGMPPNLLAGLCAALLAALLAMIWATRRHLRPLKTELATNLRILLGAGQVLSLLSDVLDLVYPRQATAGMSLVSLAVVDVGSLVSFDCRGFSWFDRWRLLVGIVPGVAAAVIFLRFLYACRRHEQGPAVAKTAARTQAFGHLSFVIMLLYPQVSTRVLAALRCRQLGSDVSVLQADYSISCLGNARYDHYQLVAILMVCAWVVGVPLALLGMLLQQRRVSYRRWVASDIDDAFDRAQATHSTSGDDGQSDSALLAAADDSLAVYNYSRIRQSFGFCVDDFKPDCYWYEPVDMLRKLALSGLLQFLKPGTGAQVLGGCVIAFASFGLQLYLRPFREPEANTLKACVDAQIFLTFLLSFILRVLNDETIRAAEPLKAEFYGWVLLSSMALLLLTGVALTAAQVRRRQKFRQGLAMDAGLMGVVSGVNPATASSPVEHGSMAEQTH